MCSNQEVIYGGGGCGGRAIGTKAVKSGGGLFGRWQQNQEA